HRHRAAPRIADPAPKNAPAAGSEPAAAMTSRTMLAPRSDPASVARPGPRGGGSDPGARDASSSPSWPDNRLRSVTRSSERSVHQMHPAAAATSPAAPATSDTAETCRSSAVVPTAYTHHERSPYISSQA